MTTANAMKPLSIDAYQRQALKTAVYPKRGDNLQYPLLGLMEEVGELAGQLKRVARDDGGDLTSTELELTPERRERLLQEAGDVIWYVSALSFELGRPMRQLVGLHNFYVLEVSGERFNGLTFFGLLWRMEDYLGQLVSLLGQSRVANAAAHIQPFVVIWAALCVMLGSTPGAVAQANLDKLASRQKRGVLHGEGSER